MTVTMAGRSRLPRSIGWHAALILGGLISIAPVVLLLLSSFKTPQQIADNPYSLPSSLSATNYVTAWHEANVAVTLRNSIMVTVLAVCGSTFFAAPAAYALARFTFRFRSTIRIIFLAGVIVPVQLLMLPFFVEMRDVGLAGNIWSLVLAYAVFTMPLGVLILTPFFSTLPREVEEAAWLDGAGRYRTLVSVILPLMRPALVTVVILEGIFVWNDFSVAVILSVTPNTNTLPVGILNFFGGTSGTAWGPVFASAVISIAPALLAFGFLSRHFVAGLTGGSVKG